MSSKNVVDRFALLPDHILEDIFFRLPWDDAVHMTVMSKAWSNIWGRLSVHCLDFKFGQNLSAMQHEMEISPFINNVDVANGKAIVKKFRFCVVARDPGIASCVDRWLELAVKNFVGELDIEIRRQSGIKRYRLPYTTLFAKPMQVLRLSGCKLEQPLYDDNVKYTYLRELCLSSVKVDDAVFMDLIHRCSALEDLTLSRCFRIQHRVKISHSSLKRLFLDPDCELEQIEIETPNLLVFQYDNICFAKLFTLNAPSLKESRLRITPQGYLTTTSFLRLRRHISNFDKLNVLAISFQRMDVKSSLLETLNKFEKHPIPVVKHLELPIVHEGLNYEAILNGLFWTCHPEILIVYRGTYNSSFNKFLREKLLNRDEEDICCDSGGIRCWRHFLKDVVMEKIGGDCPVLRFHLKW